MRIADTAGESNGVAEKHGAADAGVAAGGRWYGRHSLRTDPIDLAVVLVLLIIAGVVRVGGLRPSSLFLDDAWVSYVSKASFSDIGMMGLTAPGFLALQKVWFGVAGFSELSAQALPFVSSVATAPAFYLLLRRVVRFELALLAGVIAALTSLNVEYSYHVKQYTTEVLLGVVIFELTRRWLAAPSPRRLWGVVLAVAIGSVFSFLVVVVAAGPLLVIALRVLRSRSSLLSQSVGPLIGLGGFLGVWYLVVISANTSDELSTFWADYYLVTDQGVWGLLGSLQDRTWGLFDSLTPYPGWVVAACCLLTFGAALLRRFELGLMAVTPLIGAAVLAGFHKAPLGGGRTDNYLLVPLLFGFIVGLDALISLVGSAVDSATTQTHDLRTVSIAVAAALTGITVASYETPPPYPLEDVRPLVQELEARRQDQDIVLVYYASVYAYALYADVDSEPVEAGTPYTIEIKDPAVIAQNSHRRDTAAYLEYAEAAVAQGERIWLIGSHYCVCDWGEINRQLREDLGLDQIYLHEREGASLSLWVPSTR